MFLGTKILAFIPKRAQIPASEEPALPVDAAAISLIPSSNAFSATKLEALSL